MARFAACAKRRAFEISLKAVELRIVGKFTGSKINYDAASDLAGLQDIFPAKFGFQQEPCGTSLA